MCHYFVESLDFMSLTRLNNKICIHKHTAFFQLNNWKILNIDMSLVELPLQQFHVKTFSCFYIT